MRYYKSTYQNMEVVKANFDLLEIFFHLKIFYRV